MGADAPDAAEPRPLGARLTQRRRQSPADPLQTLRRRATGVVRVEHPKTVDHQLFGQRVDLGRQDVQPLAAERAGQLVEDSRGELFSGAHGEQHGFGLRLVTSLDVHLVGAQAVEEPQVGGDLCGRRAV